MKTQLEFKNRPQPEQKSCKFCPETDTDCLQEHHIVPRRFNGSDEDSNLVTICASCHRKIESMYNQQFYNKLKNKLDHFECPMCGKMHRNHYRHKEHVRGCFE